MGHFIYATDCPHCKVQKASFTGWAMLDGANDEESRVPLSCPHCHEVVIHEVFHFSGFRDSFFQSSDQYNLNADDSPLHLIRQYPTGTVLGAPADVPERIGGVFVEALENNARGRFETCILLCGKALDLATKGMDNSWKLERRLKKLAEDGKITQEMSDWAEEIRLDRNDAAHDDGDFTKSDAEEILGFTEAFLNYTFTLPALVKARRHKRLLE